MNSASDWMVTAGFLLALTGLALRIIVMMQASNAASASSTRLAGRDLVRAYRVAKPSSKLPMLIWATISAGLILLIAGMLLEFR